jgi:hypothetical protein
VRGFEALRGSGHHVQHVRVGDGRGGQDAKASVFLTCSYRVRPKAGTVEVSSPILLRGDLTSHPYTLLVSVHQPAIKHTIVMRACVRVPLQRCRHALIVTYHR